MTIEVMEHMLDGGEVKVGTHIYEFVSIGLKDKSNTEMVYHQLSSQVPIEIYYSPEQQRIRELEAIVARQMEEINKLNAPKQRAGHKHISKEEVVEAEKAFAKGVDIDLIMSTYNIGRSTALRIQEFKHTHSTPISK